MQHRLSSAPRLLVAVSPLLLGLSLSAGCGGSDVDAKGPAASPKPSPAAPRRLDALPRADVEKALAEGPRWVIRRVAFEPAMKDGKFLGWRLPAVPDAWQVQGLRAGDIVQKLNGLTLEKPENFHEAWVALHSARELRVTFERDGAPKELVLPIVGQPSRGAPGAPSPGGGPNGGLKGTLVIEGQEGLDAERASD